MILGNKIDIPTAVPEETLKQNLGMCLRAQASRWQKASMETSTPRPSCNLKAVQADLCIPVLACLMHMKRKRGPHGAL